jgi:hypothetical protein
MRMCIYAQNGLADCPNNRHVHYFMSVISSIPMRRDSSAELFYCCTSPQISLHTVQKNETMCMTLQHIDLSDIQMTVMVSMDFEALPITFWLVETPGTMFYPMSAASLLWKHVKYDKKSLPGHFSDNSKCPFRNLHGLTPEGLPVREILKMSWGIIALKLHRSKSLLESAYKREAPFDRFRSK